MITGNKNKFAEVKALIPSVELLDIDLPEIQSLDGILIIKEKLKAAFAHKQAEFIVEDTSVYMDSIKGLPGPLIKWFLSAIGNEGLYDLAHKYNNYSAHATTYIGYARSPTDIHIFEGTIKGTIVKPSGQSGFGWDPIFKPDGYDKSFAELGPQIKSQMSTRSIACRKLADFLQR